jgi:signal transduction histidine kinase
VRALTDAAERIAGGDLSQPVPSDVDEIGRLGAALEHMRAQLRDSIASVEQANAALERRVQERTAQLSRVLRHVISAQEDERRRVARELHDETSQLVAAMAMAIDSAKGAATPPNLADLRMLIDRMHDGLHRVIVNLRPSVLDDLGLAAAIEWLAEHQLRRAGIEARCELSDLQESRADNAIEIALFRVVQESITNIVRHSAASAVLIQAGLGDGTHAGDHVWVEIEDDGCGFDPAAVPADSGTLRGIGLMGMRERMELIGGTIEIDSAPDEGTRIRIEAPVHIGEGALS